MTEKLAQIDRAAFERWLDWLVTAESVDAYRRRYLAAQAPLYRKWSPAGLAGIPIYPRREQE